MSEREERVRLQHMLDGSRQAIAFIQGRGRKELDADLQLTLALTRLVEIVGEAAKNVSDDERRPPAETSEIKASHLPFISHPGEVARLIEQAASAAER